jgi:hypothetical protein
MVVPITTKVVSSNPVHGEVYSIQPVPEAQKQCCFALQNFSWSATSGTGTAYPSGAPKFSAAECTDNMYFIQSSDKHNQLIQQGLTCLSCFIVSKIWSTAIKIIYQIFLINLT